MVSSFPLSLLSSLPLLLQEPYTHLVHFRFTTLGRKPEADCAAGVSHRLPNGADHREPHERQLPGLDLQLGLYAAKAREFRRRFRLEHVVFALRREPAAAESGLGAAAWRISAGPSSLL